jgi:hypothetical protein
MLNFANRDHVSCEAVDQVASAAHVRACVSLRALFTDCESMSCNVTIIHIAASTWAG